VDGKDKHVFGRFSTGTLENPKEHASFIIMEGVLGLPPAPSKVVPDETDSQMGRFLRTFEPLVRLLRLRIHRGGKVLRSGSLRTYDTYIGDAHT
jgi:hypothetical protein